MCVLLNSKLTKLLSIGRRIINHNIEFVLWNQMEPFIIFNVKKMKKQ